MNWRFILGGLVSGVVGAVVIGDIAAWRFVIGVFFGPRWSEFARGRWLACGDCGDLALW